MRNNDPSYLAHVDRWWAVLFSKLHRFLYQNGGPIVMVQVTTSSVTCCCCCAAAVLAVLLLLLLLNLVRPGVLCAGLATPGGVPSASVRWQPYV